MAALRFTMSVQQYVVEQVAGLIKLIAHKGKKKEAIATATGCRITLPAAEDWDEDKGVTVCFSGGNVPEAHKLFTDALK